MTLVAVSPDPAINSLVENCGYAAAALTLLPIPGTEILGVVPLHVGMVIGIGHHHGRELTQDGAMELVIQIGTTVGFSLVGSRLATTAAKFILPGLGGLIAAPFMYASTLGLGAVADSYFRNGALSESAMKDIYKRAQSAAKQDFDPTKAKDPEAVKAAKEAAAKDDAPAPEPETDLVERLKKAKALLDEGLLSQEEYDAVKERVLSEI